MKNCKTNPSFLRFNGIVNESRGKKESGAIFFFIFQLDMVVKELKL